MRRQRFSAKKIALAAVGASISLLGVIASFYIGNLTLTFNVLAASGLLLPLSQKCYRESVLAYVAVCGLGAIFANVKILTFVLVTGLYTILTVAAEDKNLKWWIAYPVKIIYACFTFCVFYYLTSILVVDLERLGIADWKGSTLYLVFNVIYVAAFLIYDALLLWCNRYLRPVIRKAAKLPPEE